MSGYRIISTMLLAAAITAASGAAAFAHGEDGVFSGTEAVPTNGDQLTVSLRARLLYVNDNEPALGATVTVDAVDPAGVAVPAVPLTDNGDGTYEGTLLLTAPGAWTLRFTAATPNAAAEVAYAAEDQSTAPLTSVPATTRGSRPNSDDDDDGNGTGLLVLAVMAVAAVVAGGWLLRRRRH